MDYPTLINTVDVVFFGIIDQQLHVLLTNRGQQKNEPFPNFEALPGGFVHAQEDDDLYGTARRVIAQKIGISHPLYLEQLATFSGVKRDPRGWSVSQSFITLVPAEVAAKIDGWVALDEALKMKLAFDHHDILKMAAERIRKKTNYSILPAHFLRQEFTLTELQKVYEIVLGSPLEKSAFRKKINALGVFQPTGGKKQEGRMRPADLFKLKDENFLSVFRSNLQKN
jgi:8-oxo-dGTP diphosphatase